MLFGETQEVPKTTQAVAVAVALGCLPQVAGKSLLLRTLHTWDTGHRGSDLDLI